MHQDIIYDLLVYARTHGLKFTCDFVEELYEYRFIFRDTKSAVRYTVTVDRHKIDLFGGSKTQLTRRIIDELEELMEGK